MPLQLQPCRCKTISALAQAGCATPFVHDLAEVVIYRVLADLWELPGGDKRATARHIVSRWGHISRVSRVRAKPFYGRQKIKLADFRQIRSELCRVYRACVEQELDWQDGRAAVAVLTAISNLDAGRGFEERIEALEHRLQERAPPRPNGSAGRGYHARP
jgi:hypothetical protein